MPMETRARMHQLLQHDTGLTAQRLRGQVQALSGAGTFGSIEQAHT